MPTYLAPPNETLLREIFKETKQKFWVERYNNWNEKFTRGVQQIWSRRRKNQQTLWEDNWNDQVEDQKEKQMKKS